MYSRPNAPTDPFREALGEPRSRAVLAGIDTEITAMLVDAKISAMMER